MTSNKEMLHDSYLCPGCNALGMTNFYAKKAVPVHSVLVHETRGEALDYPQGDISLGFCERCGLIANMAYDPAFQAYGEGYESTQRYSATFSSFSRRLAADLIERYDLRGKKIVEIGCGMGEFLIQLCQLGENRGHGFDPAYRPNRLSAEADVRFTSDYYSEKYAPNHVDFLICKMTLEHIHNPVEFLAMIRRTLAQNPDAILFFQVPDVTRILDEVAFWDIYYEHVSYFSPASLAGMFRRIGFHVLDLWRGYDDQYILLAATLEGQTAHPNAQRLESLPDLKARKDYFVENVHNSLQSWDDFLRKQIQAGKKVILWGAGSKGVAFLTTLEIEDEIAYCVDINPHKEGTFMAGTGHPIVSPSRLQDDRPEMVLIMNPIYRSEIRREIHAMGLSPQILTVNDVP